MASERRCEMLRVPLALPALAQGQDAGWLAGQWAYVEPLPDFAVVFVHGFRSVRFGEKAQAVELSCARRGVPFASFDFRGHGESSGLMRELRGSGLLADLEAVWGFLQGKGVKRLCLVGSSMGGWASAWFSLRHPEAVIACVFIAPGFHFLTARWERLGQTDREAWKREGILRIKNEWVETEIGYGLVEEASQFPEEILLRDYRTPTLIFQGMKDDIVPHARTLAFVERAAYPHIELRLFKDGDHRLNDRKDEMAEGACEFFLRHSYVVRPGQDKPGQAVSFAW